MAKDTHGLSRRDLLSISGGVALAPLATGLGSFEGAAQAEVRAVTQVTATEATMIATAVSPNGSRVAFDLCGSLWIVAIGGGTARRLTDEFGDIASPDWSPDGTSIAFQSYRTGNFHIWTIKADGTGLTQLTDGPYDYREPRYSPDGTKIIFSSDRGGSYGIFLLDLASGAITTVVDTAADEYEPAWSPDGSQVAFTVNKARIEVVTLATGARRTIATTTPGVKAVNMFGTRPAEVAGPAFTPDGKGIVYASLTPGECHLMLDGKPLFDGEDVCPFRVTWLGPDEYVYASSGKIRRRRLGANGAAPIEFSAALPVKVPRYARKAYVTADDRPRPVMGIASPRLSPDGQSVAFRALNDIYLMPIGGKPVPLTKDGFCKSNPDFSPDGRWLAYSSDKGGKLDIWLRELATGAERQLTRLEDAAVYCTWSPDGKSLAFLNQDGALFTVTVADGAVRKIHPAMWAPGRPSFSPDGRTIILTAFKPYSARFREGQNEILTIDRITGEASYYQALPHRSISTRGDDGPHWSPDGKSLAMVIGSRLYVGAVDAKGRLTAPPAPINNEATDAPSWSGDGKFILYLNNGKLRLIAAAGGAPKTIALPLTWRQATPRDKLVVRAGRLWCGRGPDVLRDVDITMAGGKIISIAPHNGNAPPDGTKFIDASRLTVIPGLIDMHIHGQMHGYSYGDRQGRLWLSYGVTTVRSLANPAYHAIEERESIAAGARIGPRYFTTGEGIDGSRIFYHFMRPLQEAGQLELELSRAKALGYDLLKTYVRTPTQQQKAIAEWGHLHGIPTTSHYHYPALAFGQDGMEHLGGTSRFGYPRTISLAGMAYQDTQSLFNQTGAPRTPTLLLAALMYLEDPAVAEDPRLRALYPSWERRNLAAKIKAMDGDTSAAFKVLRAHVGQIKDTLRGGGKIVTATDSPIDMNVISLHMNLRAMTKFGVSPYEALVTVTRASGELLNAPLGVIEPGALADLSIVEGDPLSRIEDAANVRHVVKNGVAYSVEELIVPFAQHAGRTAGYSPMLKPTPIHATSAAMWWHSAEYVESGRHACCSDAFHSHEGPGEGASNHGDYHIHHA